MSLFRRSFVALCFLAVWLVATQHCGLEAAALAAADLADSGSACCAETESCHNDACELVEEGCYKSETDAAAVAAPQLAVALDANWLSLARLLGEADPPPNADRARQSLAWVPTRHFMQRAASSPRAPSLPA